MSERDLDVVVFGATGVTGRQAAGYLAERATRAGARWAPAARDLEKIDRVMREAGVSAPEAIAADAGDPDSLAAMAGRARVLVNLAGPYTPHARPVIEACLAAGTHYVDLTGEVPFVREIVDAFHDGAERAGVKLVQVCGFEALPFDLATALAGEAARERHGAGLVEVDVEARGGPPFGLPRPSDLLSGGTLQSTAAVASAETAAIVTDPAALVTDPATAAAIRRDSPIPLLPRRGSDGAVIAPMAPAAFINPAVIHRTAALLAAERGGDFEPLRYREGIALGSRPATLPLRYATAGALAAGQMAMSRVVRAAPPVRRRIARWMGRMLPGSGFGPAPERMAGWRWQLVVRGRTRAGDAVRVDVDADGHPGYLATARMVGEAALILAEPGLAPDRGGCLTPATALGTGSLQRFEHAGVRFTLAA